MTVRLAKTQEEWGKLLPKEAAFAESWGWGEVLKREGQQVENIIVEDAGKVLGMATIAYSNLPFGLKYAFSPQGPVILCEKKEEVYKEIFVYLKTKNCVFWRVEPTEKPINAVKVVDINPRATLVLDLKKSEEELLAGMHPKTRYNIRLSEKKGVKVEEKKDLEKFLKLMRETGERDKFRLHYEGHYRAVFDSPLVRQLIAYHDGEMAATVILVGSGNTFTYLYGASSYAHRQVMAPQLLQWEAMKLGKKLGYSRYDFFGVAPRTNKEGEYEYDNKHQYAGVTRFKLGFGGSPEERPGTFDLVIDGKKYLLYKILRAIRRFF